LNNDGSTAAEHFADYIASFGNRYEISGLLDGQVCQPSVFIAMHGTNIDILIDLCCILQDMEITVYE